MVCGETELHLPSHSGCSCQRVCPVARIVAGEKNRLWRQTTPVLSTVLTLLGLSAVLTIQPFPRLGQLVAKMRITALLFHCYRNHHPLCYEEMVPAKIITGQRLWDLRRRGKKQGDRG